MVPVLVLTLRLRYPAPCPTDPEASDALETYANGPGKGRFFELTSGNAFVTQIRLTSLLKATMMEHPDLLTFSHTAVFVDGDLSGRHIGHIHLNDPISPIGAGASMKMVARVATCMM
ncbi:hypothetical protein ETB97_007825 [Aspergillus alliaceus]|uniref:Uncharacterized protein n=1 Tax=Petromyces alliaceus TaxID=209559 RepID=A0A8H6E1R0_PETAA|nr:hypothetical protein ETB97_007825 [Aspergillus burnettii]